MLIRRRIFYPDQLVSWLWSWRLFRDTPLIPMPLNSADAMTVFFFPSCFPLRTVMSSESHEKKNYGLLNKLFLSVFLGRDCPADLAVFFYLWCRPFCLFICPPFSFSVLPCFDNRSRKSFCKVTR